MPYSNDAMGQLNSQRTQAIGHLKNQWRIEADALEQSGLSDEQFNKSAANLNAKYKMKTLEIDSAAEQRAGQLRQIQDMVQKRRMSEDEGFRQMQRVQGGPVPEAERRPFGWNSLNTMAKSMAGFTEGMERDPRWFTRARKEPRKLDSMITEYENWMAVNAYDEFTPRQQQQADDVWDSIMRAEDKYSPWFSDKEKHKPDAKVLLLREQASGRENLRTSYGNKKVGLTSPMGSAIVPKPRKPQVQGRSDPLGLGL